MADDLAAFGPFFAVQRHDDPPIAPWRPMAELIDNPDALTARVQKVRTALMGNGEPQIRVAASVAHLGLVARLLAPMIGTAALGEPVSWSLADLAWQDQLGGPYPLSIAAQPTGGAPAVEVLTDAFGRFGVSRKVLWGNVGSAANSAAQQIGRARPDVADRARQAADAVLADPRVDGGALRSGPAFRRSSCCLIYQLAGDRAACCGDCVLTAPGSDQTPA
ncbi:(2Fe-2S)-binding protein [Mycolicibacterium mucogenicum]|uniref:(2Fe-2S)-binding protein n=1 Tax=Mycolicibacterium mucogenicum TaxID=56689 RepID=UPI001EEEB1CB|nr:(2Fe-2S)-binding protein [Mycolicibacterium mucogenicum]